MALGDVIARLSVQLGMETAAFERGATIAEKRTAQMNQRFAKAGAGIAGALGGALAAAGLSNLVGQAVEMASALSEDADKLGLTVEALQELRLAANQNGVENEALASSLTKLNKSLGDLQLGSKTATKAFAEIGLSAAELKGKAPEQALALIADALNKLPDPQQRIAVGAKIMGKSFAELLPLINQGSKGLADYAQQSRNQGQVSTESAKRLDDLADRWDGFKTAVLSATANVVAGLIPVAQKIGAFLDRTRAAMAGVHDAVVSMVKGIGTAITGRLNAIWDGAKAKIDQVKGWFFGLYDAVVGHSYVPDMVDGIAAEMARLDKVMVQPVKGATSKAQQAFRDMAKETRDLLDRLFPEVGTANAFESDMKRLQGSLSGAALDEAVSRRWREIGGSVFGSSMSDPEFGNTDIIGDGLDRVNTALENFGKKAGDISVRVAKSFKDMANDTLGSLQNLTNAIKGGGFLDILGSVINFGLQLGSLGVFGKTIAGRINASVPGRATGGPISAGRPYLVGERGPELVVPQTSGRVVPNGKLGGMGGVLDIRPSPLFEAYLDGKLVQATPGLIRAGGAAGAARVRRAQERAFG